MANDIITLTARRKMCAAYKGDASLSPVTHIVLGDGGVDTSGVPIPPYESDTSLNHLIATKDIQNKAYIGENKTICRYSVTLIENELSNKHINEIGLLDSAGELVAKKTFQDKIKDADMEMSFDIDMIF